jgi:hypothetical protein
LEFCERPFALPNSQQKRHLHLNGFSGRAISSNIISDPDTRDSKPGKKVKSRVRRVRWVLVRIGIAKAVRMNCADKGKCDGGEGPAAETPPGLEPI